MDEYGETRVGPARHPDVLSALIDARLTDGAVIIGHDGDAFTAGLVLRFVNGDLVIGTLADEWVLGIGSVPASAAHDWMVQPFVHGGGR